MSRRKHVLFLVAALLGVSSLAGLYGLTRAEGGAVPNEYLRISNAGVAISPTPLMQSVLEKTDTADGALLRLGTNRDATFYRITGTAAHGDCFGVGRGDGSAQTLNFITCGVDFPSVENPVLDGSTFELSPGGSSRFDQLTGWASDRVSSLALYDASGAELLQLKPSNNVYYIPRAEMPNNVVRLAARDASGAVIWELTAG